MRLVGSQLIVFVVAMLSAAPAWAQTELDRLLVRVNGSVITLSDVRQARALKLVTDVGSDDAAQRGLENRLLMLGELTRMTGVPEPTDDMVTERRRSWQQAIGGADVAALLRDNGMSQAGLDGWIRDDARIEAYVRRQFGVAGDPNRERAYNSWLDRLRQRAGLR